NRSRVMRTRIADVAALPQLGEVLLVPGAQLRRIDADDVVLFERPGVLGPIRRAGPDRLAVADDVLVVHELRQARIAAGDRLRADAVADAPDEIAGAGRRGVGAGRVKGHVSLA